jgi:hypothetical protein
MKHVLLWSVLGIIVAYASACKKKKSAEPCETMPIPEPAPVIYQSYSKLKPGNYWIYQRFQVEQNSSATPLDQFDSVYVEKDTLIRNQTYFKIHEFDFVFNREMISFLRDSLHYIIASNGGIVFSSEDFSTVFSTSYSIDLNDTIFKITKKMNDKDLMTQTPAGSFLTSNMQSTYFAYPKYIQQDVNNPRYLNLRFAKNIGLVTKTELFFLVSPTIIERRLTRYHLN